MAASQATINVRMNATLKERGDQVLKDNGISTSQAIRSLWSQLAQTRAIPEFMADEQLRGREEEKRRKKTALLNLSRCAQRGASLTDEELSDLRFQALMDRYEALS